MSRMVDCSVLGARAEGLAKPPYPGELGRRIYENVSAEGWRQWLERLVIVINEYQLNSADPASRDLIEKHMAGFLFGEGEQGQAPPEGYQPG